MGSSLISPNMPATPATLNRAREVFIQSLRLNLREEDLPAGRRVEKVAGLDSNAMLEFVAAVEKESGAAG
jgi:acyl carrier protein